VRKTGPDEAGTGGVWSTKDFFFKKKHHAHQIGRLAQPLGRHERDFFGHREFVYEEERGRECPLGEAGN
jgi:hypothetical protein